MEDDDQKVFSFLEPESFSNSNSNIGQQQNSGKEPSGSFAEIYELKQANSGSNPEDFLLDADNLNNIINQNNVITIIKANIKKDGNSKEGIINNFEFVKKKKIESRKTSPDNKPSVKN